MNKYLPSEEQLERIVERKFDNLDARFMATGSQMTQAQYDAESAEIIRWANVVAAEIRSISFGSSHAIASIVLGAALAIIG